MTLPVSIVVVSRDRPELLMRCLTGIGQLNYPSFEIIVVACPKGAEAVAARSDAGHIKLLRFDEPNISKARNLGISHAAGDVVAFIDDDAVPEPTWLAHLIAPFAQGDIAATGGYVIGRNGISFQWKARSVNDWGETDPIETDQDSPFFGEPLEGFVTKTEGTNMAVRKDVLLKLGGFDPGFAFYLDETDLNFRLAQGGYQTMIVPLARVHHGFAQSVRRSKARVPLDLFEIGASQTLFLRKFCPAGEFQDAWRAFVQAQRVRLLRLMQSGPLGPDDVLKLMRSLRKGQKAGLNRDIVDPEMSLEIQSDFSPFPSKFDQEHVFLSCRSWQKAQKSSAAAQKVAEGSTVTLLVLSHSSLFHRVEFHPDGFWLQTGGLFGKSDRKQPIFQLKSFGKRVEEEKRRIAGVRFP